MTTIHAGPATHFHIVADANRLRILRLLRGGELTVRELVAILGLSQPAVSKHLALLRGDGWVTVRKEGTWSWYGLAAAEDHPAGPGFARTVLEQAARIPEARRDDRALQQVLAERQRQAGDLFAAVAETWDQIRPDLVDPEIQAGAVAALVPPGLPVLDAGTGGGALLPLLAAAGARITAVDRSAAMLARARRLCEREGIADQVAFRQADVQELPLADASFAAVTCTMVLHHVASPAAAVREMARVLRPGGRLVLVAFTHHDLGWMRDALGHLWLGFTREEIDRLLADAGLDGRRYLRRELGEIERARAMLPPGLKSGDIHWPDLFLAVGEKPIAGGAGGQTTREEP